MALGHAEKLGYRICSGAQLCALTRFHTRLVSHYYYLSLSLSLLSIIIGIPVPYPYFTHLRSLICIFFLEVRIPTHSGVVFVFLLAFSFITRWEARDKNTASYLVLELGLVLRAHGTAFSLHFSSLLSLGAVLKDREDDGRVERQQWVY
jgi:hypothetical protein